MKTLLTLFLLAALSVPTSAAPRVVVVAANEAFDLDELATAHAIFELNGLGVDLASPSGGAIRPKADDEPTAAVTAFLAKHGSTLARTVAVADLDPNRYAAIFLVGGGGAMREFPAHVPLQRAIASLAGRGAVISAVCHGAAALLDVRRSDGRPLLSGLRITAFTEEEEARFGARGIDTYPFVLERALRERGARFEERGLMLVHVARDANLVTGQNPFSTARTADEVVRALGMAPRPRELYREEATLLLVEELLATEAGGAALDAAPRKYDVRLIGMYGAMLAGGAREAEELRRAVRLLEAAGRHVRHPKLESALSRALLRLAELEEDDHGRAPAAPAPDRRRE